MPSLNILFKINIINVEGTIMVNEKYADTFKFNLRREAKFKTSTLYKCTSCVVGTSICSSCIAVEQKSSCKYLEVILEESVTW